MSPDAGGEGRFIRPTKTDAVFTRVIGTLTRLGLPLAGSVEERLREIAPGVPVFRIETRS